MKTAAIALSAALVGAVIGIAGSLTVSAHANEDERPKPATGAEIVLVAEHFDRRMDKIEKGLDVLAARVHSEIEDAEQHTVTACNNR